MKKGFLFASIGSVAAISCSAALILGHNNIRIEVAKAEDRSVSFNASTNLPGAAGEYCVAGYDSYEATPNTAGDKVITQAYVYAGGSPRVAQFGARTI